MDKHSNPRSRPHQFSCPPAKKPRLSEMSAPLPAEMYLEILQNLPASDLKTARLVSKKFDRLISNYGRNMNRSQFNVTIKGTDSGVVIEHNMKERINANSETLNCFDYNHWTFVEVHSLELNNLKSSSEVQESLDALLDLLIYYKQFHIRNFRLIKVELDASFAPILEKLFSLVLPNCKEFLQRESFLPITLTEAQIEASRFQHFRWLDSPSSIPSDKVLQKFTKEMSSGNGSNNFHVELGSASTEIVTDFIEEWMKLKTAPYFNIVLSNCDQLWKELFFWGCAKRQLKHYCLEFQSKAHDHAHIKVSFNEEARICRIWPIFDVPAKVSGGYHCSARYFRDF